MFSYLHDDQEDERHDDDDDDDEEEEVDSRCYAVAVVWGIHSRSCELAPQKAPSFFQAFPTLPVPKHWTGRGSL